MVVKAEICAFTEFRIFPGHGMRFVRKDGTAVTLINSKAKRHYLARKKPARVTWTTSWRKLHKKGQTAGVKRSRRRRAVKTTRAVSGITVDDLKKKKSEKPDVRKAAREVALREVKLRKAKAKAAAKTTGGAQKQAGAAAKHAGKGR